MVALPPEDVNQHGVVEAAQAQVVAAEVEPARGGGQRRGGPGVFRRRAHQSHVLDEDVQRAAGRLELALDHPGPPVVEHEGRRGALPQHPPALRRGQAERLRERQGLGGGGDVHAAQQLVDELHPLAIAGGRPDHGSAARQRGQHRLGPRHRLLRAGHHDQQVAGGGPRRAPGHRGVDHGHAPRGETVRGGDDRLGPDRRHDHHDAPGRQRAGRPAGREQRLLGLLGRGDHDHGQIRAADRGGHRARGPHAVSRQGRSTPGTTS